MAEERANTPRKIQALREIVAKHGGIFPPDMQLQTYLIEQAPAASGTGCFKAGLSHNPMPQMLVNLDEHGDTSTSTSNEQASASSSSSSSGGPNKKNYSQGWQVVWCQESCFRDHKEQWRHTLKMLANLHGADLACIKRPNKLAQHFESLKTARPRGQLKYWVAVTTWREAKPVIKLCEQGTLVPMMPRFMVVVCEAGSQYRKASNWAESRDRPCPIYCVREGIASSIGEGSHSVDSELLEILDLLSLPLDELPLPSVFHLCRACTKSAIDLNAVTASQLPHLLKHSVRLSL